MAVNILFYKTCVINKFFSRTEIARKQLLYELTAHSQDPVIFMRRIRMLKQLADFESQMVTKINNFNADSQQDYLTGLNQVLLEIDRVTARNA